MPAISSLKVKSVRVALTLNGGARLDLLQLDLLGVSTNVNEVIILQTTNQKPSTAVRKQGQQPFVYSVRPMSDAAQAQQKLTIQRCNSLTREGSKHRSSFIVNMFTAYLLVVCI